MRPLFRRYPRLCVPFEPLVDLPTPVEPLDALSGEACADLRVKRDDACGKGRKLEFFVPRVRGKPLVALGPEGSNWLLGLAHSGLPVRVLTVPQYMNESASANRRSIRAALALGCCAGVLARALAELPRLAGGAARLAPLGGTDPVTTLGYVNAAFELVEQWVPDAVYVPLGTGGAAAGLALGFALAGLSVQVKAVRITVGLLANEHRVRALAAQTARILGEEPPELRLAVLHNYVGRGYAHPLPAAEAVRRRFPLELDSTYSAKTAAAFLDGREARRLLWLTWGRPHRR